MIMVGGSFFHSFFLLSPRALGPHGGLFHFVVCLFSFGGLGQLTVLRMSRKKGKKKQEQSSSVGAQSHRGWCRFLVAQWVHREGRSGSYCASISSYFIIDLRLPCSASFSASRGIYLSVGSVAAMASLFQPRI